MENHFSSSVGFLNSSCLKISFLHILIASGRCISKLGWKENWIKVFTHPPPSTISETSNLGLFSISIFFLFTSDTICFVYDLYHDSRLIESRYAHLWHNLALWFFISHLYQSLFEHVRNQSIFFSHSYWALQIQQDFYSSESVKWSPPSFPGSGIFDKYLQISHSLCLQELSINQRW